MKSKISICLCLLLASAIAGGCIQQEAEEEAKGQPPEEAVAVEEEEVEGEERDLGQEPGEVSIHFKFVEGDQESWRIPWTQIGQKVLSPSWFRFEYLSEGPSLRYRQFGSLEDAKNNVNPLGEKVVDYVGMSPEGYSFVFGKGAASVNIELSLWNFPPKGYAIYKCEEGETKWTFEGLRVSGKEFADQEVFQLPDGSYRMYLADSEHETKGAAVASSPDGLTWSVESEREEFLHGPSVLKLPDGRYMICDGWSHMTAFSSDGYNWENKIELTTSDMEPFYPILPSVIILPDGTYRMYYGAISGEPPIQRIYSAHSSDGLIWELDPGIRIDGSEAVDRGHASSPDVYIREDGKYEMVYISGGVEIYRAVSDDGLNWTRTGYTGIQGLDPIINVFPDGTVRMYYAVFEAPFFPPLDKPPGIYSAIRGPIE